MGHDANLTLREEGQGKGWGEAPWTAALQSLEGSAGLLGSSVHLSDLPPGHWLAAAQGSEASVDFKAQPVLDSARAPVGPVRTCLVSLKHRVFLYRIPVLRQTLATSQDPKAVCLAGGRVPSRRPCAQQAAMFPAGGRVPCSSGRMPASIPPQSGSSQASLQEEAESE